RHYHDSHSFPTRRSSDLCSSLTFLKGYFSLSIRTILYYVNKCAHLGHPFEKSVRHLWIKSNWYVQYPICILHHSISQFPLANYLDRKSTRLNSSHVSISY